MDRPRRRPWAEVVTTFVLSVLIVAVSPLAAAASAANVRQRSLAGYWTPAKAGLVVR